MLLALSLLAGVAPAAHAQSLTEQDPLAGIKARGELRWGADAQGGAPYVFLDPRDPNKQIGFELEIVEALARKLGVKPKFVQGQYESLLDLVGRGDVDLAINGIEATEEKKRVCELSRCYYVAPERLAIRASDKNGPRTLAALKGRKAGTLGETLAEKILRESGADVKPYGGGQEALYDELENGRIDAVLIDEPVAIYYGALRGTVAMIDAHFGEVRYSIASKKGALGLREAIDAALDQLGKDGTLRAIYERWGIWNSETAALLSDPNVPAHGPADAYEAWRQATQRASTRGLGERLADYWQYRDQFAKGVAVTLAVSLSSFALAVALGIALALARSYGPRPVQWLAVAYIEVFRGTPLLVQLFFVYFALPEIFPALGTIMGPFLAGWLGLGLNYAAAEAENYRAGLESVPVGQVEACFALGLTKWQAIRYVVAPQAVRLAIPPATNDFIALLKDSSLVSVITLMDLMKVSQTLASSTRDNRVMFALCALIYLLLGLPFSRLARLAEQRLGAHLRRAEA